MLVIRSQFNYAAMPEPRSGGSVNSDLFIQQTGASWLGLGRKHNCRPTTLCISVARVGGSLVKCGFTRGAGGWPECGRVVAGDSHREDGRDFTLEPLPWSDPGVKLGVRRSCTSGGGCANTRCILLPAANSTRLAQYFSSPYVSPWVFTALTATAGHILTLTTRPTTTLLSPTFC